jgi:hypothetical protein
MHTDLAEVDETTDKRNIFPDRR